MEDKHQINLQSKVKLQLKNIKQLIFYRQHQFGRSLSFYQQNLHFSSLIIYIFVHLQTFQILCSYQLFNQPNVNSYSLIALKFSIKLLSDLSFLVIQQNNYLLPATVLATRFRKFTKNQSIAISLIIIFNFYNLENRVMLAGLMAYLNEIGTTYPNLSFFLSFACFSWLGNAIMTQYLIQKQIRHWPSRIVFLMTFSCSISLLSMYLFQIMRFPISQNYWYIVMWVLVIMVQIVIPLCLISRLPVVGFSCKIWGIEISAVSIVCSLAYIGLFTSLLRERWLVRGGQIFGLKILIDIVVHYGVYLMALMSAYGAIWSPYVYYNLFNQKQMHRIANAKLKTQEQIHFIIDQTKTHKYQILKLAQEIDKIKKQIQIQKTSESTVGRLIRVWGWNRPAREEQLQKFQQQRLKKKHELQTLEKVHEESFLHYRDILQEERRHMVAETLLGKLFRKMSFILAAYSITRILLTIINTIRGREMSADPITRLLILIKYITGKDSGEVTNLISQYISFFFMGYLMITSVRSFSMNLKAFLDYILRRRRLNILDSATQIYFFSLVYGVYFLAAVILQQCGLPRSYASNFEMMTGVYQNSDLLHHFILFDWLFMGMCLFSICLVLFTEYQRGGSIDNIIRQRNLVDTTTAEE